MTLTFLGNCAVSIFDDCGGVLIDAPNGRHTMFDAVPERLAEEIAASAPPYDRLLGLLFTHRHSDHYDRKRLAAIRLSRPELACFDVSGATPPSGTIALGGVTVRFETVAHSGAEFHDVFHRVLLVRFGDKSVYITGDADWTSPLHAAILREERPTAAIWNPNFVSHPEGRALLPLCANNFIYHIPVGVPDSLGIAGKCRRSFERYAPELANVTQIDRYPFTVTL